MNNFVYFIQAGKTGLIKIGWTGDITKRLRNLRAMCPDELILLAKVAGGATLEGHIHDILDADRAHGEWFIPSNRVLDFITRVKHYGDQFSALGYWDVRNQRSSRGTHTICSAKEEARAHALVLRDSLERRGYARMAAYEAIGRESGTSLGWVRKLIGRSPEIALSAHAYLNLRDLAAEPASRWAGPRRASQAIAGQSTFLPG